MGKGNEDKTPPPSQVWLRTCEKETLQPVEGEIKGKLPAWLNGRLTRNGPGRVHFGDTRFNHLFDGSSYIHQFIISNEKVFYQSRYLQSDTYKRNKKADRIVVSEFGTAAYPDPCKNILQRFMSYFTPLTRLDPTDNCVVNVCHYGDQLYALTETSNMRRIDPETLAAVGEKTKLDQYIAVNTATAHPHVDPDGTVYNMGNSFVGKQGPTYNIIKFPPPKEVDGQMLSSVDQAEVLVSIPCQWKMYPSYYHSFGITDNYFIFVEQPFVLSLKKFLFNHYLGKPYLEAMEWHGDQKTKFHVVRRDTLELLKTTYTTDAFMTFHHTNAYEKDGHLVVDLAALKDATAIRQFMLKKLANPEYEIAPEALAYHKRFILPLNVDDAPNTNLVTEEAKCSGDKCEDGKIEVEGEVLSKQIFEFPRINYKLNGKEYTYAYGAQVNSVADITKLVKMNVQTGETRLWCEEGKLVSEPVFVPTPGGTREDDGVVLSTLIDKYEPRFVALLVLEPDTWTEMARAEFQACGTVTSTFHGQFAAANETVHTY